MANEEQLAILKQGVDVWNAWRKEHREQPNLSEADLRNTDLRHISLSNAVLRKVNLEGANLSGANLGSANLSGSNLRNTHIKDTNLGRANLHDADLRDATLYYSKLTQANLSSADLRGANLHNTDLSDANLNKANLSDTDLSDAILLRTDLSDAILLDVDFRRANLSGANMRGADLSGGNLILSTMIGTRFENAKLSNCRIYGISAWNVTLEGAIQSNLIITDQGEPEITVDNLEIAQFIYLLLHNEKLRDVIDTVGKKAVLILGRFTEERKAVLKAIRDELRQRDYIPILFDFEKPSSRDVTETVSTLAHMARFVIADLTDAKSIPQELAQIVPHLPSVAVQPLILQGQREYGMFEHWQRYGWVLPIHVYENQAGLIAELGEKVITPAEAKVEALRQK